MPHTVSMGTLHTAEAVNRALLSQKGNGEELYHNERSGELISMGKPWPYMYCYISVRRHINKLLFISHDLLSRAQQNRALAEAKQLDVKLTQRDKKRVMSWLLLCRAWSTSQQMNWFHLSLHCNNSRMNKKHGQAWQTDIQRAAKWFLASTKDGAASVKRNYHFMMH